MTPQRCKLSGDPSAGNHRESGEREETPPLIPGLPDHISHLCLSQIPPSLLFSVSSSWRRFLYSPLSPPFLSLYALFAPTTANHHHLATPIKFYSFDPISAIWVSLPDPPLRLLLKHPSFISRNLPVQSLAVDNKFVVLAGSTGDLNLLPALSWPLVFDTVLRRWERAPPLQVPRRWCVAGGVSGMVVVASGIGHQFSSKVARSVEKWDVRGGAWKWERAAPMKDGRLSREAVDAVGWKGKLYMVNIKGDAAKEGAVYDVERDQWEEMAEEMVVGWRGPAASMAEEVIYVVDESKGVLRRYDESHGGGGRWVDVLESERLRGAQHIAAGGGRVCVVGEHSGDGMVVVVDVVAMPPRLWVVEPPPGLKPVAIRILPRICWPHYENGKCETI